MYKHIYVPVDNSDFSNRAIDLAVELGRAFGSKLTGCHVYAARLHDYRFKQMEYTLPEEYKDETELERQRKIHDSLIAMGLQLISESYLDVMKAKADAAGLSIRAADDGRQALQGADRRHPGLRLRPGHHGRARHGRGEGQPARLGDRALRPPGDARHAGRAQPRRAQGRPGRHRGRPRRLAPVLPRPQARPGPRQGARPAGAGRRRLRPVSALRDVQRHRRRAEREGVEDLPLQGAGAAARGDHRYWVGQDLPVAPGDRAQAGGRRRASISRSRCSTASASRRC